MNPGSVFLIVLFLLCLGFAIFWAVMIDQKKKAGVSCKKGYFNPFTKITDSIKLCALSQIPPVSPAPTAQPTPSVSPTQPTPSVSPTQPTPPVQPPLPTFEFTPRQISDSQRVCGPGYKKISDTVCRKECTSPYRQTAGGLCFLSCPKESTLKFVASGTQNNKAICERKQTGLWSMPNTAIGVGCKEGYIKEGNVCKTNCKLHEGWKSEGNLCVKDQQSFQMQTRQSSCPVGEEDIDNVCYLPCPEGTFIDDDGKSCVSVSFNEVPGAT